MRTLIAVLLLAAAGTASAQDEGDDSYYWISGGAGTALAERGAFNGSEYYGSVMGGANGRIYGISQMHMWINQHDCPPSGCVKIDSNIKETAALIGGFGLTRHVYFALGPSRVQVDGYYCPYSRQQVDCVATGLATVLAFELPNRFVGAELRFFGDFNEAESFGGFTVGLRFGTDLKKTWQRIDTPARQRNAPWLHEAAPADYRPPAAAPQAAAPARFEGAPGSLATLKSGAAARGRPTASGEVLATIPAGASVTLKSSIANTDGTWWYVDAGGKGGWVRADELDFSAR